MHTVSITSRLEWVAEFGAKEISLYVWNSTVKRLSNQDIRFTDTGLAARKGEGYYLISWADAVVEDLPEDWVLDDIIKERHPSQGQVLWLMAEDYARNKAKKEAT